MSRADEMAITTVEPKTFTVRSANVLRIFSIALIIFLPCGQNPEGGNLVTTTYRDYDLLETSKPVGVVFFIVIASFVESFILLASCRLYGSHDDGLPSYLYEVHSASIHSSSHGHQELG
jgi:hypothetical protein